jgi:hypothetical protein
MLENKAITLSQNVGKRLPSDAVSYRKKKPRNFWYAAAKKKKKQKQTKLAWFTKANAFVNDGTVTSKFAFSLVCLDSKCFL